VEVRPFAWDMGMPVGTNGMSAIVRRMCYLRHDLHDEIKKRTTGPPVVLILANWHRHKVAHHWAHCVCFSVNLAYRWSFWTTDDDRCWRLVHDGVLTASHGPQTRRVPWQFHVQRKRDNHAAHLCGRDINSLHARHPHPPPRFCPCTHR
jgi:hypothetical protein